MNLKESQVFSSSPSGKLNLFLWSWNKKLHNQNDLNWIFKKYWVKLNFYSELINYHGRAPLVNCSKFQPLSLTPKKLASFLLEENKMDLKGLLRMESEKKNAKQNRFIKNFRTYKQIQTNNIYIFKRVLMPPQTSNQNLTYQQFYTQILTLIVLGKPTSRNQFNNSNTQIKKLLFNICGMALTPTIYFNLYETDKPHTCLRKQFNTFTDFKLKPKKRNQTLGLGQQEKTQKILVLRTYFLYKKSSQLV
jgi:hypothetical protein